MKHWDLRPGERVTLSASENNMLAGRFKFRDTRHAAILILCEDGEEHLQFFTLTETGDLKRESNGITRVWTIRENRDTDLGAVHYAR